MGGDEMTNALNAWERAAGWYRLTIRKGFGPYFSVADARELERKYEATAQLCDLFGAITRTIDRCADAK